MADARFREARLCPLCAGAASGPAFPYVTQFNDIRFVYLECGDCASVFVDPIPDSGTFARMYAKAEYHDRHYQETETDARSYLASAALLRRYLPAGAMVLDFGCGVGSFLLALKEEDLVPFGVEFDEAAAEHAARRATCTAISVMQFGELRAKPNFDAIHLGDVLEHLPDPSRTLDELLVLLKPSGVLFVEGPLEINPSPVYWAARLFGAVKHRLRPNAIGTHPPTHLFRTAAKQQLAFLLKPERQLVVREWGVYETGWPYGNGGVLKRMIAAAARTLGSRTVLGMTFGNRFQCLLEYEPCKSGAADRPNAG